MRRATGSHASMWPAPFGASTRAPNQTIYHVPSMPTLYLVRHCQATSQSPEASLPAEGLVQADLLADFLAPLGPERIVSSPFRRAVQSVEPLAARLSLPIEIDDRLRER